MNTCVVYRRRPYYMSPLPLSRFKFLAEQYDVRERQLEKIHEQINLETQLNEAKLAKIKMETTIEREILLKWVCLFAVYFAALSIFQFVFVRREKEAALEDLLTARTTVVEMQGREKILKGQLNLYTEKYEDFQNSLQKSNDIFSTYKAEIDKVCIYGRWCFSSVSQLLFFVCRVSAFSWPRRRNSWKRSATSGVSNSRKATKPFWSWPPTNRLRISICAKPHDNWRNCKSCAELCR